MESLALFGCLMSFGDAGPERRKEAVHLESLWQDLTGRDGGKAYRAMWAFVAIPEQTVPYLAKRLEPDPEADATLVGRLISELKSDQFALRRRAQQELEKLGALAKPALRRALVKDTSEEFRRRAEYLLKLGEDPTRTDSLRIVEVLERIASTEARQLLQLIVNGAFGDRAAHEARASLERLNLQRGPLAGK